MNSFIRIICFQMLDQGSLESSFVNDTLDYTIELRSDPPTQYILEL